MPKSKEQIEHELKLAQKEVERIASELEAKTHDERSRALEKYRELAILAHDTFCCWDHNSGCGWGYECDSHGNHNWEGSFNGCSSAHVQWLKKIEEIFEYNKSKYVEVVTIPILTDLIAQFSKMRKQHREAVWFLKRLM